MIWWVMGRLATMVKPYDKDQPDLPAEDYLNEEFFRFLEKMRSLFIGLFERLARDFPNLKIIFHGYDRAIPNKGKWLGKPLEKQGIKKKALQAAIVSEMIDQLNTMQIELTEAFQGKVYHVDCRGAVDPKTQWHDELHPTDAGFASAAARFREVIERALSDQMESDQTPLCPGKEATADDNPLSNYDSAQIAIRRARCLKAKDKGASL